MFWGLFRSWFFSSTIPFLFFFFFFFFFSVYQSIEKRRQDERMFQQDLICFGVGFGVVRDVDQWFVFFFFFFVISVKI